MWFVLDLNSKLQNPPGLNSWGFRRQTTTCPALLSLFSTHNTATTLKEEEEIETKPSACWLSMRENQSESSTYYLRSGSTHGSHWQGQQSGSLHQNVFRKVNINSFLIKSKTTKCKPSDFFVKVFVLNLCWHFYQKCRSHYNLGMDSCVLWKKFNPDLSAGTSLGVGVGGWGMKIIIKIKCFMFPKRFQEEITYSWHY